MRRSYTLVLEALPVPQTDAEKIEVFHRLLGDLIHNRMIVLRDEAATISNDMEALVGRLQDEGHSADLQDIRSARWYRTAAQLAVLKKLYSSWCQVTGRPATAVILSFDDDEQSEISEPDSVPEE